MLKDQINADLLQAMKDKNEAKVRTLRMVKTSIMKHETSSEGAIADDEKVMSILKKELKQRKDSVDQFTKGGREDLAAGEIEEIEVLETYLPEEMSDDDLRALLKEVIDSVGAKDKSDFGKAMGASMKKVAGRADGSRVKSTLEELLS